MFRTKSAVFPHYSVVKFVLPFDGEDDPPEPPKFNLQEVLGHPDTRRTLVEWAEREIASGLKQKNSELIGKLSKYKIGEEGDGDNKKVIYLDPEEAVNAIKFKKENPGGANPKKVEEAVADAVREANERKDREIASLNERLATFDNAVREERTRRYGMMIDNGLQQALLDSGIKPSKLHLHKMYLANQVGVEADENGKEMLVILDDAGKVRYGQNGAMTLDEYVLEYSKRDGIDEDWEPVTNAGGGSQPNFRRGVSTNKIDPNLSPTERLKIHRQQQRAASARR